MPDDQTIKNEEIYEVVQLITGASYIYRGGYKEEANVKDVFRFDAGITAGKQVAYQFSRFDFNPAKPIDGGTIRLNQSAIVFAWMIDANSDVVRNLKDAIVKMDAARAGLIIPGAD